MHPLPLDCVVVCVFLDPLALRSVEIPPTIPTISRLNAYQSRILDHASMVQDQLVNTALHNERFKRANSGDCRPEIKDLVNSKYPHSHTHTVKMADCVLTLIPLPHTRSTLFEVHCTLVPLSKRANSFHPPS